MENVDNHDEPRSGVGAGATLRAAREKAGLSRAEIATRTKIAERHLVAIEEGRFGDLAARTYAVGFARTYARSVGLDENAIANEVRGQLDAESHDRPVIAPSFEPGDPARVPSRRLAWVAAGGVVVVIGVLLVFWSSYLQPEGTLPDLTAPKPSAAVAATGPAPAAPPPPVTPVDGPVVLTAAGDQVWIKVTDATGTQVVQKELKLGETWTVPQGTNGPQLRTGRPDALQITVGGRAIPSLSTRPETVSGVSLKGPDLLARLNPAAASAAPRPAPSASLPAVQPTPAPAPPAPSPSPLSTVSQ